MLKKLWNSPTFMTWGNLIAKSSNLFILLPIVLSSFSQEDIVVWYLYFTIVSLQLLIDFGFLPTFSRLFSYAYSGLNIDEIQNVKDNKIAKGQPNWISLEYLFVATKKIYAYLSILSFLMAITMGSYLVYEPISKSTDPQNAWLGWLIVITIASLNLYTNSFIALLNGMDKVALVQKWQMISSFFGVVASSIALLVSKSLLLGISIFYFSYLGNFFINMLLVKKYYKRPKVSLDQKLLSNLIKKTIFPTAWKSGLGIAMSLGIIQLSNIIVAKIESALNASSYMVALQIIRAISSFAQAPFYSRLPYFAQLYSKGHIKDLIELSIQRVKYSLIVFIFMFFFIGIFGSYLLGILDSKTNFVDSTMWILIGLAFFLERVGAMNLQLYTLSNHIVWHIANGITGIIMIITAFLLYHYFGLYGLPIAMILSYSGFYVPYTTKKMLTEFPTYLQETKSIIWQMFTIFVMCSALIFIIGGK